MGPRSKIAARGFRLGANVNKMVLIAKLNMDCRGQPIGSPIGPPIEHVFDAFSMCVWDFQYSNFTIFSGNLRFRVIFVGSSTGFFEKYTAFDALLMCLFDFSVFFMF